jgi:predicted ATPase
LEIECIPVWLPTQRFYHSLGEYQKGDAEAIRSMSDALSELVKSNHIVRMPLYLGVLAQALVEQGDIAGARTRLSEAFSFAERRAETWTNPELLRIAASLLRAEGDTGGAQQNLREAIRTALGSGALCFALKAANDLAEIHLTAGRRQSARDVLQPVYGCFSEGFDTRDLARASSLLKAAGVSSSQARKSPAIGCESDTEIA